MERQLLLCLVRLGAVSQEAAKRITLEVIQALVSMPRGGELITELSEGKASLEFELPDDAACGRFVVKRGDEVVQVIEPKVRGWGIAC